MRLNRYVGIRAAGWAGLMGMAAVLGLTGCAGSGGHHHGGSLLSEASEEAEKEPEDQDRVLQGDRHRDRHHHDDYDEVEVVVVDGDCDRPRAWDRDEPEEPSAPRLYFAGAALEGTGFHESAALDGGTGLVLQVGGVLDGGQGRTRLIVDGSATSYDMIPGAYPGIEDPLELALGGALRVYLTPGRAMSGMYAVTGFRVGAFFWDYTNPILVDDGHGRAHEVDSDFVNTWTPYLGLGLSLFKDRGLGLDLSATGGFKIFGRTTDEGFRNDVFQDAPYTQVAVTVSGFFQD